MVIEAPAWGLLAIGLLFTFAFLWVWDKTFRATLGPALRAVGNVGFGGIHGHGRIHPLRFLVRTADSIEAATARGLQASEHGIVYSLNKMGDTFALLFGVPLAIALALYELAQYVAHVAPGVITKTVHETVTKPITRVVKVTAAVTKAQFRALTTRVHALEARVAHATHVATHAVAAPFPRIGQLEKTVKGQSARLKKIEKALAAGASAALVWTALRRLGLKWLRCGNVNKAGKAVCGMNPALLEALLLDAAVLTVAFDLETFARELQAVAEDGAGLIHRWAT